MPNVDVMLRDCHISTGLPRMALVVPLSSSVIARMKIPRSPFCSFTMVRHRAISTQYWYLVTGRSLCFSPVSNCLGDHIVTHQGLSFSSLPFERYSSGCFTPGAAPACRRFLQLQDQSMFNGNLPRILLAPNAGKTWLFAEYASMSDK